MSNLYARLVKGEDERTEALADLLERVLLKDGEENTEWFRGFVSAVLLARPTSEPKCPSSEYLGQRGLIN